MAAMSDETTCATWCGTRDPLSVGLPREVRFCADACRYAGKHVAWCDCPSALHPASPVTPVPRDPGSKAGATDMRNAIIAVIPAMRHHSEAENADAILAAIGPWLRNDGAEHYRRLYVKCSADFQALRADLDAARSELAEAKKKFVDLTERAMHICDERDAARSLLDTRTRALEEAIQDVADAAVILHRLNYPSSAKMAEGKVEKYRAALTPPTPLPGKPKETP